jgi:hypothetical protein
MNQTHHNSGDKEKAKKLVRLVLNSMVHFKVGFLDEPAFHSIWASFERD